MSLASTPLLRVLGKIKVFGSS